jgi:hypothetical protein
MTQIGTAYGRTSTIDVAEYSNSSLLPTNAHGMMFALLLDMQSVNIACVTFLAALVATAVACTRDGMTRGAVPDAGSSRQTFAAGDMASDGASVVAVDSDAGRVSSAVPSQESMCKLEPETDCGYEGSPCTWAEAQRLTPPCGTPPNTPFFAVRCGAYDGLVAQGTDTQTYAFYDATGKLVGTNEVGLFTACISFDSSFTAPPRCVMVTPKCSVIDDAGI